MLGSAGWLFLSSSESELKALNLPDLVFDVLNPVLPNLERLAVLYRACS